MRGFRKRVSRERDSSSSGIEMPISHGVMTSTRALARNAEFRALARNAWARNSVNSSCPQGPDEGTECAPPWCAASAPNGAARRVWNEPESLSTWWSATATHLLAV